MWIPGYSGINGNEKADKEAKQASRQNPQLSILRIQIGTEIYGGRHMLCGMRNGETQQLRHIKPVPGKWCRRKLTRRVETILNRLRSSHTCLTHKYLMQGIWQRRVFGGCDYAYMTVEHILVSCNALTSKRPRMIKPCVGRDITNKKLLGKTANPEVVLRYLAQLKLLDMI